MAEFKVGDNVRVITRSGELPEGTEGVITSVRSDVIWPYRVKSNEGETEIFNSSELELIEDDAVNSPSHYTWLPNGLEVIDITEQFSFTVGNAIKYLMRAGRKDNALEDYKKARWYLDREIAHLERDG